MTDRIEELENEFGPCNESSKHDLLMFTGEPWVTTRPCITLLDNGRFRAFWGNCHGEQAGIQFRGDHVVHVVLFFRPFGRTFIGRMSGRCLIDDVPGMLKVTQLYSLLTAHPQGVA